MIDSKSAFFEEIRNMSREDIELLFENKRIQVSTKKIYPLIILGKEDINGEKSKDSATNY